MKTLRFNIMMNLRYNLFKSFDNDQDAKKQAGEA